VSPALREPEPMLVQVVVAGVIVREGTLRQALETEERLRELDYQLMEEYRANREAKANFQR